MTSTTRAGCVAAIPGCPLCATSRLRGHDRSQCDEACYDHVGQLANPAFHASWHRAERWHERQRRFARRRLIPAADRTASKHHRAGSRRNRRYHNVPTFTSDRRSAL